VAALNEWALDVKGNMCVSREDVGTERIHCYGISFKCICIICIIFIKQFNRAKKRVDGLPG
jgi:hypothetical protein